MNSQVYILIISSLHARIFIIFYNFFLIIISLLSLFLHLQIVLDRLILIHNISDGNESLAMNS